MSFQQQLENTARDLVSPGRGILAADESTPTIKKRFDSIGVESLEETRRFYRDLLFSTEGAEEFISGVIFFDETLRQSTADGTPFSKLLSSKGITPGIKVDKGAKPLAGAPGETVTEGLDGLRERLDEYRGLGAGVCQSPRPPFAPIAFQWCRRSLVATRARRGAVPGSSPAC